MTVANGNEASHSPTSSPDRKTTRTERTADTEPEA